MGFVLVGTVLARWPAPPRNMASVSILPLMSKARTWSSCVRAGLRHGLEARTYLRRRTFVEVVVGQARPWELPLPVV